jgi:WD40 repeat protein
MAEFSTAEALAWSDPTLLRRLPRAEGGMHYNVLTYSPLAEGPARIVMTCAEGLKIFCDDEATAELSTLEAFFPLTLEGYELPGGRTHLVCSHYGGQLSIFNAETFATVHTSAVSRSDINALLVYHTCIDRHPRIVAANDDGDVRVLDGDTGVVLRELPNLGERVRRVANYNHTEERGGHSHPRVAVGGDSGRIAIYDPETGAQLHVLQHEKDIRGLMAFEPTFAPGRTYLASASYDGTVKCWDAEDGRMVHSFDKDEQAILVIGVAVYKAVGDGADRIALLEAMPQGGAAKIYDAQSGAYMHTLRDTKSSFSRAVAWESTAGPTILALEGAWAVTLWDPEEARLLFTFPANPQGAMHTDYLGLVGEGRLAIAADTVAIWDLGPQYAPLEDADGPLRPAHKLG